jgi:hypothetical protein
MTCTVEAREKLDVSLLNAKSNLSLLGFVHEIAPRINKRNHACDDGSLTDRAFAGFLAVVVQVQSHASSAIRFTTMNLCSVQFTQVHNYLFICHFTLVTVDNAFNQNERRAWLLG